MQDLGWKKVGETIDVQWNTVDGAGASITRATNGSIRIYKDNSTTQRSSSNGITDTEDFDSLTGVHHLRIDLSDNTDAGFYADGSTYHVVLQGAVIDGETVNATLFRFRIGTQPANATQWNGTAVATPATNGYPVVTLKVGTGTGEVSLSGGRAKADTVYWDGQPVETPTNAGVPEVDVTHIRGNNDSAASLTVFLSTLDGISAALTEASFTAGAIAAIQNGLASQASVDTIDDYLDTEIAAIKAKTDLIPADPATETTLATLATLAKLRNYVRLLARKDSEVATDLVAELDEINDNTGTGTGTYDNTTDSLEANRDNVGTAGAGLTEAGGTGDQFTGLPDVTLATSQPNYAPAKAGDEMDLVDAPNATAVAAIQSGLATAANVTSAESNIRGADNDTLKTLSDQIDAIPTSNPSAATIADAVWDEDTTGHTNAGTFGAQAKTVLDDVPNTAEFEARTLAAADYFDASTDEVTVGTNNDKTGYSLVTAPPTAAENATELLDRATSGHTTAGTVGKAIADAATLAETAASQATIAAAESAEAATQATTAATEATGANSKAATIQATTDKLDDTLEDDGGTYRFTANALEQAPSGGGGGLALSDAVGASPTANTVEAALRSALDNLPISGSGPRAVTITVRDASNATVQGVRVVLDNGTREFSGTSDANGVVSLSLYDEGYTATGAKDGYTHTPQTFTVSAGSTSFTLNVVELSITIPGDPDLCTGYFVAIDPEGAPESGATFYCRLVEGDGTDGYSLDTGDQTATSAANGLVEFPLMRGKRYIVWRGTTQDRARPFTVPDQSTYAIPEFLGTP